MSRSLYFCSASWCGWKNSSEYITEQENPRAPRRSPNIPHGRRPGPFFNGRSAAPQRVGCGANILHINEGAVPAHSTTERLPTIFSTTARVSRCSTTKRVPPSKKGGLIVFISDLLVMFARSEGESTFSHESHRSKGWRQRSPRPLPRIGHLVTNQHFCPPDTPTYLELPVGVAPKLSLQRLEVQPAPSRR